LPAVVATSEAHEPHNGHLLCPSLMTGALQAGIRLISDPAPPLRTPWMPHTLKCLRVWRPCSGEKFSWARHSHDAPLEKELMKLNIDLTDMAGNVCVQMHGLYFQGNNRTAERAEGKWLFSTRHSSEDEGAAAHSRSIGAVEKMELFLRQEAALHLQQPIEKIATDHSYFDLGLNSLGIATLLQRVNLLLGVTLMPSVLFEYRDIGSLSSYLAATYPSRIDGLTVTLETGERAGPGTHPRKHAPALKPLARKQYLPGRLAPPSPENGSGKILERVVWQETSLDDSYEKVTL